MKKVIVFRLENVLVKKFDVEKSFELMVKRMEKKRMNVDGLMRSFKEDLGLDWKERKEKEMVEKYESDFVKKEINPEGKKILRDLLGLKRMNKCLEDISVVVLSETGGRKVKKLLKNNGFDEEDIEVRWVKEGEIEDFLSEMGVNKERYGKVVVLSNSDKEMVECERLGIKCEKCGWNKDGGIVCSDIYSVIGLRKR